MNCEDVRNNFHGYLDGEMKPRESHVLETHLKTCFHCKAELGVLQRTVRLIGELKPYSPPRGFDQRILTEMGFEIVPLWRRTASFVFVLLTGTWMALFFQWILRSLREIPGAMKTLLHLPASLTFFPGFTRTLIETGETLLKSVSIVLWNIPSIYWVLMVFVSLLLTLLFVKSLATSNGMEALKKGLMNQVPTGR